MISHKHKFIFIHIPKCGGTSVEWSLLQKHGLPEQRVANWNLTDEEKSEYRMYYKYGGETTAMELATQMFGPLVDEPDAYVRVHSMTMTRPR